MRSDRHRGRDPQTDEKLDEILSGRREEIDAFRSEYESTGSDERSEAEKDDTYVLQSRKIPSGEEPEKPEKPVKKRSVKKIVLTIIIAIVVIAACGGAGAWYMLHHATSKMDKVDTSYKDFDISSSVNKNLKNYENIAILGVDARKNEKIKGSRSDAIIVCSINKETKEVRMMSIMRDSYLQIEDKDDNKYLDKVTHAHAYGGATDTAKALNRNLDLNIQEFLVFNWKAVADMVDALNGITVDIKANELQDLNHYGNESAKNVGKTYTPITKTGKQNIDGAQAVTYCRIRKTSGGDTGRADRYKKVMGALVKKARKMKSSNLKSVVSDVLPEIQTNMGDSTLLSIMMNASEYTIGDSYSWPPKFYGGIINGTWYAVPTTLESNAKWLHKKLFGQKDYEVTDRLHKISEQIISESGIDENGATDDETGGTASQSSGTQSSTSQQSSAPSQENMTYGQ